MIFPFLVVQASLGHLDFWVSFFPLLVASFHSSLPSVQITLCCLEEGIPLLVFSYTMLICLPCLVGFGLVMREVQCSCWMYLA